MSFLTRAGEQAIEDAVAAIEAVSAAEVVVAVRPRAHYALLPHGIVAGVFAIGMLAIGLFSPIELSLWQIFVLPIFAGVAGGFLVEAVPPLYRLLSPPWQRHEHVREAACTTFLDRGIHGTRGRTGILVYVALREQMIEIIADTKVCEHHGIEVLADWSGRLEAQLPRGSEAFAKELSALFAPALAKSLPRQPDDIDELTNAAHLIGAPPHSRSKEVAS